MIRLFPSKTSTCAKWDFRFCDWFLGHKTVGKRGGVGEEYRLWRKTWMFFLESWDFQIILGRGLKMRSWCDFVKKMI